MSMAEREKESDRDSQIVRIHSVPDPLDSVGEDGSVGDREVSVSKVGESHNDVQDGSIVHRRALDLKSNCFESRSKKRGSRKKRLIGERRKEIQLT